MYVIILLLGLGLVKTKKSHFLINIHEIVRECRRACWDMWRDVRYSVCVVGALFWTKDGVDTCSAVIKIKQRVFRYSVIFLSQTCIWEQLINDFW